MSFDGLDDAAKDGRWRGLLDADPCASAFQGASWLSAWESRAEGAVGVRRFGRDDELVGVVVEVDLGDGRRTIAGGRDVTDYRGPVARGVDRPDVARAWLDALARDDVVEITLHGMPTDAGWLDILQAESADAWTLSDRAVEDVCPCVDLRGGERTAWMDRIDGKERHELRRKSRKLARDLGGMAMVEVGLKDHPAGLDRFWEMAVTAEQDKGEFFKDRQMRAFFDRIVASLGPSGDLRIHELVVGGLPAASMLSVVQGKRWGLYNSSFDANLAAHAPGTVLVADLATAAAAEGFEVLDFLRGDEAYKYRFGAHDRVIEQARLVRR